MAATTKTWMAVALFAALAIGAGSGILLDRYLLLPATSAEVRTGGGRHREHGQRMLEHLRERLELTETQAAELEKVLERNHETARRFWSESREGYEAIRQQFRRDIRALLTEEQREKFDAMVAEYEGERRRRHER